MSAGAYSLSSGQDYRLRSLRRKRCEKRTTRGKMKSKDKLHEGMNGIAFLQNSIRTFLRNQNIVRFSFYLIGDYTNGIPS